MKKLAMSLGLALTQLAWVNAHANPAGEAAAQAAKVNGTGEAATADDRAKASKPATADDRAKPAQPASAEQKAEARAKRKAAGKAAAQTVKTEGSGEAATADDRAKK